MLSPTEVVRHLLRAGLLDACAILDGELWIDEVSRRNRSFKVQTRSGPCYFVKQGIGAEGEASVEHEASTYRYLTSLPPTELQKALPHFHGYDESKRLLVLGLSPGSLTLREFHKRHGRIPTRAASAAGRALARLHRLPPPETGARRNGGKATAPAWPLSLHRPDIRLLPYASGADLELIRMIQEFPEFCRLLDRLRSEWKPVALIHYDLKAENCVLQPDPGSPRGYEIRIVDWEGSGPGDPCWDVGSIFSDYLGLWLLSIPVVADIPPERFLELTRHPLDRMYPAIRAFWSAYTRALDLSPDAIQETLLRSVRYSAARLLQTAFEQMQTSQRLTGNVVCLLQLSWNILERPEEAATRLLGVCV